MATFHGQDAVKAETKAVAMVPALGPSLGVAPSGAWMRRSRFFEQLRPDAQALGAGPHDRACGFDRLSS